VVKCVHEGYSAATQACLSRRRATQGNLMNWWKILALTLAIAVAVIRLSGLYATRHATRKSASRNN
jgi:hypothetical protein